MKSKGFTLIELMIVIVIVGIIATVSAPNVIGMFTSAQVREEAQMLTITIKNLQGHAALQRAPYSLTLDFENQCYRSARGESKFNDFTLTLDDLTGSGKNILGEEYSSASLEAMSDHLDYYDNEYAAVTNLRSSVPMHQTSRTMPSSVILLRAIDEFDEVYGLEEGKSDYDDLPEGNFTITFDQKGFVNPCTIVLQARSKASVRYIVEVDYDGQTSCYREERND